jgi:hypothetical protein
MKKIFKLLKIIIPIGLIVSLPFLPNLIGNIFFDKEKIGNSLYSKTMFSVYYFDKVLEQADHDTFEIIKTNESSSDLISYAKDKNHLYYDGKILEGVDSTSVEILQNPLYLKTNVGVFFNGEKISEDLNNFRIICHYKELNENDDRMIPEKGEMKYCKDLETTSSILAADTESIYLIYILGGSYKLEILKNIDIDSFLFLTNDFVRDKNKAYRLELDNEYQELYFKQLDVDVESFKVITALCTKDKNNVYFKDKIVEGVNPESFDSGKCADLFFSE